MTKYSSITMLGLAAGLMGAVGLAGCGDDDAPPGGTDSGVVPVDSGGGTGDGGGGGAPTCAEYCTTYSANCTEARSEYSTLADCMTYCSTTAGWMAGTRGAVSGNTIGCRLYHAGTPAMDDPAMHCPHAGPSGAGVCGMPCEGYCELALRNCTGANMLYADLPACMTACAMFPTTGTPGDTTGNTVQCRIYHAGSPAADDPTMHCPHAGPTGGGVCAPGGG